MKSLLVVVVACFVLSASATLWPCSNTFPATGNTYNLGKASGNTYHTDDGGAKPNNFYFKLCDPTTTTPGATAVCPDGTQVCQQDGATPPNDVSCGNGPATWSEGVTVNGAAATGVTLWAQGGKVCTSNGVARNTKIQVVCRAGFNKDEGFVEQVDEATVCSYTITLYSDSGCVDNGKAPKGDSGGLSGGGVFLIIFFVGFAVYFAAGIGYNAYRQKEGVELIPNVEFWKDLPFLCKDGAMFIVGKVTGGGGGYSSVE